jgi:hypothetical protein
LVEWWTDQLGDSERLRALGGVLVMMAAGRLGRGGIQLYAMRVGVGFVFFLVLLFDPSSRAVVVRSVEVGQS